MGSFITVISHVFITSFLNKMLTRLLNKFPEAFVVPQRAPGNVLNVLLTCFFILGSVENRLKSVRVVIIISEKR